MEWLPAAFVAALLMAAGVVAQSDNPFQGGQPGTILVQTIEETTDAATVEFQYAFRLSEARSVFLKVSPSTSNPAYDPDGDTGWSTNIALDGPGGLAEFGATSSNDPVDLGDLAGNVTYTLLLTLHVPAGALEEEMDWRMSYILAAEVPPGAGTGSQAQPSVDVRPILKVEAPPPEPEPATNDTVEPDNDPEDGSVDNGTVQQTPANDGPDSGLVNRWLDELASGGFVPFLVAALGVLALLGIGSSMRSRALRRKQEKRLARLEQALKRQKRGRK